MSDQLKGKVAIITGAASGMGKAMAELFASEGASIVAADLNEERLAEVSKDITDKNGSVATVKVDVSVEADINKMFDTATETFGKVDILVNNAGIMDNMAAIGNVTDEMWNKVIAVNTTSVMMASRKAAQIFLPQKHGVILNIASAGGVMGGASGATYTASKHAVVGLTKNTAYMYQNEGIRTNAITPGGIATNIVESMKGIDEFGMGRQSVGMPTSPAPGDAGDIAEAALFLVSDKAKYINGAILPVDGGWTAY
ncbi:SDR family oxidoreductase [Secundilactobacillus malefermentans]|uniref:SDR family oxidoreductase n=1 Tax=Secundilactobacillus malefermentans TaxID=176292 RepID=UPI0011C94660|nr:SDR family oxidoreductase [Secundilactobacillus malefermentans]QEA31873.1 SDR family oxidoreductase [Secundilactobacillus malefermentans]